jgi:hypothetical protein
LKLKHTYLMYWSIMRMSWLTHWFMLQKIYLVVSWDIDPNPLDSYSCNLVRTESRQEELGRREVTRWRYPLVSIWWWDTWWRLEREESEGLEHRFDQHGGLVC